MADKIKEKAPIRKELKEKVKAAPKELLRRGLDDGTERLRSQFRDTAQHGQRDGYGGDQIEDAAWRGSRWGERGIEKLLKKKKTDRSKHRGTGPTMPPEAPTEPPSGDGIRSNPPNYPAPADGAERVRIKMREAITSRNRGIAPSQDTSRGLIPVPEPEQPQIKIRETAVRDIRRGVRSVSPDRTEPPQIRTRESVFSEPPASVWPVMRSELERPQIKTREYIAHESSASAQPIVKSEQQQPRIRARESIAHESSGSVQPLTQSGPDRPRHITGDIGASASLNRTEAAVSPDRKESVKQLAIKTRETRVQMPPTAVPERSSQAMEQGRRKFQREQGEKAATAKRFGERRAVPESHPVLLEGEGKPPVQRSSPWRQIAQGGDAPVMTKGRAVSPAASSGKAAVKVPSAGKKSVGRKAGQTVKTAEQSAKQALKSVDGVKTVGQTAQVTQAARKRAVQAICAIRKPPAVTVKGTAKAGTAALRATVRAAQTLAAALATGGSVVVSVILVLCLVGVLVASPFGIFFASGDSSPDAAAPSAAVAQINGELSDYLAALQAGGTYDRTEILGQPPAWADVFAVFAAKTAGAADGVDVVTLDTARIDLLRTVFWDMTKITAEEETVNHPASGSTPAWSETVLKITITPRTPDDMRVFYSFTDGQNQALDSLLAMDRDMWNNLIYGSSGEIVAVALSQVGNVGGQPYWSWYGFNSRVEWCACFVSWCANECGCIDTGVIPKFSSCTAGSNWFKARGQWQDGSYEPHPGDLIFFDWDEKGSSGPQNDLPDHVGIVERVEGGIIYTVEGNSSDSCRQRSYNVGHYEIWGYGCPTYNN